MDQWLKEIPSLLFTPWSRCDTARSSPMTSHASSHAQNGGPPCPARLPTPRHLLVPVRMGAAPRGSCPHRPHVFGCCRVGFRGVCGSDPTWGGPLESRGWVWAERLQRDDLSPAMTGEPGDDNCVAIAAVFIYGLIKPNPGVGTLHRDGV